MSIDFEVIRQDLAAALDLAPEEIGMEDNLGDLGLDSMRMLTLVSRWQEMGMELGFLTLAETQTLAAWQAALHAHQNPA